MPPRFYCRPLPAEDLSEAACALGPDETRHARRVLRLSEGAAVELFDGEGRLADAELTGYADGAAVCRVTAIRHVTPRRPRLTVAAAVPKGPRAEDMVNQLGQLGVDTFVPLRCARGVVEPGGGKLERYERAALASAKQSGRPTLMRIAPVTDLAEVLAQPADVRLVMDPEGSAVDGLPARWAAAEHAVVLVGPEGGWTAEELGAAEAAGFARWRVAEHVLRVETAAVAAAAVLRQAGWGG